ncbi:MAG: hypothetical protein DI536_22035 [Archangium gephyra]|uniref:Uncharacterized protein n=1 Tax=Archangium gephyra TaxID=48 RepID=A0A2W5T2K4_9BACT|nr:MAG: hypothetical protein DI536_22035 [Archangium gephyra]
MPSAAPKPEAKKLPFPIPWGLFIVLDLYAVGVAGYIWATYYNAPEYQAAVSYAKALKLLGVDDGRKCSEAELVRAFGLTLEAARLMPQERGLVEHLENLRHRFDERKFKLPPQLKQHAEMMSANTLRIEQSKKAWLVVGTRDRGWGPEQLLRGPERAVLWSIPGAVFIIAFWAYTRFSHRAARAREHEDQLKAQEREVDELGNFRRGLKSADEWRPPKEPEWRPPPQKRDDEADTLASPRSVRARPPSQVGAKAVTRRPVTRPPTAGSGVKPVKRRPPSDD